MKHSFWKKNAAGILALLLTASCLPAQTAFADSTETETGIIELPLIPIGDSGSENPEPEEAETPETPYVPDFGAVTEMPSAPFGAAGTSAPYHAKPCNERLATLPESLMKLTDDGYSWSGAYGAGKPEWALTLMDYANIYSYIHTHEIDADTLRAVLADADSMLHHKAFTAEEIELLLGDDPAAAMAAFASPGTVVIGEKGYCPKWMYCHTPEEYAAEGITPEMVAAVQDNYYNPLYVQDAADAFSQKLFQYTGKLSQTKWHQWTAGDLSLDGAVNADDTALLTAFLSREADLTFRQWASADMDGDSDVDQADLTALQEKVQAGITAGGVMLDVIEFCQYPDYPTGCESVSLYMLLNYYNVGVTVDQIYDLLPMGAQPYDDENGVRHGANPEREFVGDPRSEYSYGVFNDPIAGVAEQFKPGVRTERGVSLDKIKEILDTGNPVLAWYVSAPMRDIMYRWSWLDERNELVTWPGGEHAVVICGYDDTSLTYRDPNAGTTVCIDYATFEKSFSELGSRIVYYTNEAVTDAVSYTDADNAQKFARPTVLTGKETKLAAGWYAVTQDVTIDSMLLLEGDVNLILADDCTLTVTGGINGPYAFTVYGQNGGSGALRVTAEDTPAVKVGTFTLCGGSADLVSGAEIALTGTEAVNLLGGRFTCSGTIYTDNTITLGFSRDTDFIQAGGYQCSKTAVADGKALYIPALERDLSLISLTDAISLIYNGEMQKPEKADVVDRLWVNDPLYTAALSVSDEELKLAAGRKLCPYPEEYDPKRLTIQTALTAEDFAIGQTEAGRDVTAADDGSPAKEYEIEIIGRGSYTGSRTIGWTVIAADVSGDITVTPKAPLLSGEPVTAEDFDISASSPLAKGLTDALAEGRATAAIGVYSTKPLSGDALTAECRPDTALEKGHIFDLHDLGLYSVIILMPDTAAGTYTYILPGQLDQTVYVMQDGERRNGCVEIGKDGVLSYYSVNPDGADRLVTGQADPNLYWVIQKRGSEAMPLYTLCRDFTEAQRADGTQPGDYLARIIISGNDGSNYESVTKVVPFTVEASAGTEQIADDRTLLAWAEKDYQDKTGTRVTAAAAGKQDGKLTVALTDENGRQVDTYVIDTATGTGTDAAEQAVNLPQTGRHSLRGLLPAAAAMLLLLTGSLSVQASRVLRRREEQDETA